MNRTWLTLYTISRDNIELIYNIILDSIYLGYVYWLLTFWEKYKGIFIRKSKVIWKQIRMNSTWLTLYNRSRCAINLIYSIILYSIYLGYVYLSLTFWGKYKGIFIKKSKVNWKQIRMNRTWLTLYNRSSDTINLIYSIILDSIYLGYVYWSLTFWEKYK